MRILVTLGPSCEPLDAVRRLTNFSTGKLGTELANYLTDAGHEVTALRGHYSTWRGELRAVDIKEFATSADLLALLQGSPCFDAVFHAAAVSDFAFGSVFEKRDDGVLTPVFSGKYSTRAGTLLAELVPTPKIIARMRSLFPGAKLIGWKYEVDGARAAAVEAARHQILENHTDGCVVNGPAYGAGYGLVVKSERIGHCQTGPELFQALDYLLQPDSDPGTA
ncbi:MAG TPA: phosphopantothenoylcysteine decarboxylase [Verrucomicrobiae bacterium]|nr:phosphopantothenoylcysteine decarboxylase [Verrucomicrobiae bacterium]